MKVFVLEDDPLRVAQFRRRFADKGWDADFATDARSAISFLASSRYDAIFLDHDLGGEAFVSSREKNTGAEVARWMASNCLMGQPVIVHSLNGPGASNIQATLRSAGIDSHAIPFVWGEATFRKTFR